MPVYLATFLFDGASLLFSMSGFLQNRSSAVARAHAASSRPVSISARPQAVPSASGPSSFRTPITSSIASAVASPIVVGAPGGSSNNGSNSTKRPRKDRLPNWSHQEVLALISIKRDQFFDDLNTMDKRDLMVVESSKWLPISKALLQTNLSPCLCDATSCKAKWNLIILEYKHISDYLGRTKRNLPEYWDLSAAQYKQEALPKQFPQDTFHALDTWFGSCPIMHPLHVQDLLSPTDCNYGGHIIVDEVMEDARSQQKSADAGDFISFELDGLLHDESPALFLEISTSPAQSASTTPSVRNEYATPTATAAMQPSPAIPLRVILQLISSSGTSSYSVGRRGGNIGVKRKFVSGPTLIADATRENAHTIAKQMEEIAKSYHGMEHKKIDVQFKIFSNNMEYLQKKDEKFLENATKVNAIAKLTVIKQGEIVGCLSKISRVLSAGLGVTSCPRGAMPPPASLAADATACNNKGRQRPLQEKPNSSLEAFQMSLLGTDSLNALASSFHATDIAQAHPENDKPQQRV